jgi:hypothetical protein
LVRLAREAANWSFSLPLTDQLKTQKDKKLDWHRPTEANELALRRTSEGKGASLKAFIEAGGALPRLIHGENPPYADEAMKRKPSVARTYDVIC